MWTEESQIELPGEWPKPDGNHTRFHVGDVTALDLKDNCFDLATGHNVPTLRSRHPGWLQSEAGSKPGESSRAGK